MKARAGVCIDVWEGGAVCAMLYIGEDKGRLRVVSPKGREMHVPESRVANVSEQTLDLQGDRVVLGEQLRAWEAKLRTEAESVDLESLWEILTDEGGQYELDDLTELAMGLRAGNARSVVLRRLLDDQLYFSRKQLGFTPQSREIRDRTVERRRSDEILADQRDGFLARVRAKLTGRGDGADWPEPDRRFLDILQDVAVFGVASKHLRDGQEILSELGLGGHGEPDLAAFDLMVKLGELAQDENVLLTRYGVVREFSPEVLAVAAQLRDAGPLLSPDRRDLRALECFTIDDGGTTEVDDALSIEALDGNRVRVGIHIADPSPYVPKGSLLDAVARDRSTTFYLPEERLLMLPPAISEGVGSLTVGMDRTALTFQVDLDSSGEVLQWQIFESIVRVKHRLDYEQADVLIGFGGGVTPPADPADVAPVAAAGHAELPPGIDAAAAGRLAQAARLAQALLDRRAAAGALILKGPDLEIKVSNGEIKLRKIEPWTASWVLVSEMMVLANWIAARVMRDAGVKAIYRRQAAPDRPIELDRNYDPAAAAAARRRIKPTDVSIQPGAHAGLGLDVYVQCTSPLRRYQDLVGHRQLKAALNGGPVLTDEELWAVIASCGETERAARDIERGNREYWLFRHFESLPPDATLNAVVTRPDERRTLVELTDYAYLAQLQPRQGHKPGRILKVVVDAVNPRAGRLVLREV